MTTHVAAVRRRREDVVGRREELGPGARGERRGRRVRRRLGAQLAARGLPGGLPAVEHADVLEAEVAQQPPEPRRPCRGALVVDHDAAVVADAERRDRRREALLGRHGEREPRPGLGEVGDEIGEGRSRHVAGVVACAAARDGRRAAVGREVQQDRRVQDPQTRVAELAAELLGAHQAVHARAFPRGCTFVSRAKTMMRFAAL